MTNLHKRTVGCDLEHKGTERVPQMAYSPLKADSRSFQASVYLKRSSTTLNLQLPSLWDGRLHRWEDFTVRQLHFNCRCCCFFFCRLLHDSSWDKWMWDWERCRRRLGRCVNRWHLTEAHEPISARWINLVFYAPHRFNSALSEQLCSDELPTAVATFLDCISLKNKVFLSIHFHFQLQKLTTTNLCHHPIQFMELQICGTDRCLRRLDCLQGGVGSGSRKRYMKSHMTCHVELFRKDGRQSAVFVGRVRK